MATLAGCLLAGLVQAGLHPEAVKAAQKNGIALVRMDKVPDACKIGAYEASVTVKNIAETPLRGSFALMVATTDEEDPAFRKLASDRIDLTLASVSSEEKELMFKAEIGKDLVWRDVKVVIDARGQEIVLFDGFIPGEGERPARTKRQAKEQPIRRGQEVTHDEVVKGDDFFLKEVKAVFVTPDGRKDASVAAAKDADWDVEDVFRGDAAGWQKLAAELDEVDAVVSTAGFPAEAPVEAISNFVAKGGLLWVNGGRDDAAFAGLSFLNPKARFPNVAVREVGEKETDNHILVGALGAVLHHPGKGFFVDYVPVARFESTRETGAWGAVAVAQNTPRGQCGDVVLLNRLGNGFAVASTTPSSDAQFYENLRYHLGLQRNGLGFIGSSGRFYRPPYEATANWRHDTMNFSSGFANYGTEPRDYRVKVVLEYGEGRTKTLWKTFENVQPGFAKPLGFDYSGAEICGKTHAVLTCEDLKTGYTVTRDLGTQERPDFMTIKTPPQHGWVSEKRVKPSVTVGVMYYDAEAIGQTATLETYSPDGSLLAKQEGVIRQGGMSADKGAWFEVPTKPDSPCGDYRLVATVGLNGETHVRESRFSIRAVVPGQTIFDQDGTLITEGKRYYGFGAFHLGHFDSPIGPWVWDREKKQQVIPADCLKEDGTPFTLWDIGLTFTQCWQGEWEYNCSSDVEILKEKNPIDAIWSVYGREAIDYDLLLTDWKGCVEQCRARIEKEPDIFERWAKKNAERAKRAKKAGLYFCIEQGVPGYIQMLYPNRGKLPWEDTLRYTRNDYQEVKDVVNRVNRQDTCKTIGGWYVADECGGSLDFAKQRDAIFAVDKLHPSTLLGDVNALHFCTEFGLDQTHPDVCSIPDQHPIDGGFLTGRRWRLGSAPHDGGIICCHRSAGNARAQTFDTLFTVELGSIVSGLNGAMWYTWREDQRLRGAYGSGWDPQRPRDMKRVVDQVKEIEPYFLKFRGTCAKTDDGRCRVRVCGDDEVGKIVICVNFERAEDWTAALQIPELAGKKLVPFYEKDAKPVPVGARGQFHVAFKPDVSRVFKVEEK